MALGKEMALSISEAQSVFNRFFLAPSFFEDAGIYRFDIKDVGTDEISALAREFQTRGSKTDREDIIRFINCDYPDSSTRFPHLPAKFIAPGEVLKLNVKAPQGGNFLLKAIKLSDVDYLYFFPGNSPEDVLRASRVKISPDDIFAETGSLPFLKGYILNSVSILSPDPFYRAIDLFLLDERYAESLPKTALPLFSRLAETHFQRNVKENWDEILELASSLGLSTFSIFNILEYLAGEEQG